MKKLINTSVLTLSMITLGIVLSACNDSKMNNDGNGKRVDSGLSSNDLIQPDYYYELDTWGTDADVFEFTLQSNPNMVVVNVGEGKNRGIFVIPKLSKEENERHLKNRINSKNDNNPVYDTDYYYEVDTWGTNADIFEFTPRSNYKYSCVSVGSNHSLNCFLKKEFGGTN